MKLKKPSVQNPKVKKIVEAAGHSLDDAVNAIKESGLPNAPIITSIAEMTGLKKKSLCRRLSRCKQVSLR